MKKANLSTKQMDNHFKASCEPKSQSNPPGEEKLQLFSQQQYNCAGILIRPRGGSRWCVKIGGGLVPQKPKAEIADGVEDGMDALRLNLERRRAAEEW
jgi:hypothetical protein